MIPLRLFFAALLFALIPFTSSAQAQQNDISISEELFEAVHLGYMPIVIDLVERGANVNYLNRNRETPMHAAAARGHLEVMQYLRSYNAYLHPRTVENWVPLHHAVRFGHQNVVSYLLANGAPLNLKTRTGQSVFDIAKGTGDVGMLNLLQRYR